MFNGQEVVGTTYICI